jgi:hypothetical protein
MVPLLNGSKNTQACTLIGMTGNMPEDSRGQLAAAAHAAAA